MNNDIHSKMDDNILNIYFNSNIKIKYGSEVYLYDEEGNSYLDFSSGLAVNNLGYNISYLNNKLKSQIDKAWHISNFFKTNEQQKFAKRLCDKSFADYVFFASSGTESVEAAIKFIRRYHYFTKFSKYLAKKNIIITFEGAFHGRTMGALSCCGYKKAKESFEPFLDNIVIAKRNDISDIKNIITKYGKNNISAIMLELVQSEGGVHIFDNDFLKELNIIALQNDILIFIDEIQTAYGRCGSLFAYKQFDINPDIITLSKAIGNGFPLAATLVNNKIANYIDIGSHGSTYSGNPLAMSVGNAVLDIYEKEDFFFKINNNSNYFKKILDKIYNENKNLIKDIRSFYMIAGIEFYDNKIDIYDFVKEAAYNFLIITKTSYKNTIRILPPLIAEKKDFDKFYDIFTYLIKK